MPTTTTSYSFQKPTVGGDDDNWGGYLNNNWDKVDDLLDGTTQVDGIDFTNAIANVATFVASEGTVSSSSNDLTLDQANGLTQYMTMTENVTTFTDNLAQGESILLVITASSYTISWPAGVKWMGGAAPTLDTTDENWVCLWKNNSTLYGSFVGVAATV